MAEPERSATRILFKLEGPAFDLGVDLHLTIKALTEFHNIVDKTFLVLSDKQRMSPGDRRLFRLVSQDFQSGSFITYIDIIFATQLVFPFIDAFGPKEIWKYTKDAFEFLRLIFTARSKGAQVVYNFQDEAGFSVQAGDQTNHYHAPVYKIGTLALTSYRDLSELLSKDTVKSISAGTPEAPEISLSEEEKDLFHVKADVDETTVTLDCEIYDFNKFTNNGKLRVMEHQTIPTGDYSFSIFGSQDNIQYIYSMLRPKITVDCFMEMREDPFEKATIARIHIVRIVDEEES